MIFNFFHTFSSISRDMKIVTLNKIHRYIQNFMLYKKIYFSSHKFAFSNLRFSPFYEHFRQLREKYAFKLKIKYIMSISSLSRIWWCAYIWLFLKKNHSTPLHSTPLHSTPLHSTPLHSTHSTELFKIFFSLLTLSTAFLQKASGPGKNYFRRYCANYVFLHVSMKNILNRFTTFFCLLMNRSKKLSEKY